MSLTSDELKIENPAFAQVVLFPPWFKTIVLSDMVKFCLFTKVVVPDKKSDPCIDILSWGLPINITLSTELI